MRVLVPFLAALVSQAAPAPVEPSVERVDGEPVLTYRSPRSGELRARAIYLEAPDYLVALMDKPTSKERWAFPAATDASLRALLERAGVPEDIRGRLLDPDRRIPQDGALVVFPSPDDILALTQPAREAIYRELAKSELNEFHRDPVFVLGGDVEDWLRQSRLGPRQKEVFRRLLWRKGRALAFSDVRTLLAVSETPDEAQQVFRTMTRTRSLLVELRLPVASDLAALSDYWGSGSGDADSLPLLQAAAVRGSVAQVGVINVLPSLGRRRLYTYPTIDQAVNGRFPDCHWTSLNFFNNAPHAYYLDTRLAAGVLEKQYDPVKAPYRFGDVLAFVTDDAVIHSCVFIAEDIVFTKNGENVVAPWVLQRLEDVSSIYQPDDSVRIQGYRLKPEYRGRQR